MTFPLGRIITGPISPGLGPIEDRLNPSANSGSCFCFRGPYRLQNFHNQSNIYCLDRQRSKDRADVVPYRRCPLRGVLLVLPAAGVRFDLGVGTIIECHAVGRLKGLLCPFGAACDYGIDTVCEQGPAFGGLRARCRKSDGL